MEPSPLRASVVPKLHLLTPRAPVVFPKLDSARQSSPLCSRGVHEPLPPSLANIERVSTTRLHGASAQYLNGSSPKPHISFPLKHPRPPPPSASSNNDTSRMMDEFCVLHPALDATDQDGELSKLLLSKWSPDAGETTFASISLFCEMKLSEAQRMTSWLETPNRFFTTVCCQLLGKYLERLENMRVMDAASDPMTLSVAFLRKIHDALVSAIFLPPAEAAHESAYENRVPYFQEHKKLRHHAQWLLATVETGEHTASVKEKLPHRINTILKTRRLYYERTHRRLLFRAWAATTKQVSKIRELKCSAFRAKRELSISTLFRTWRIEALRRAYQRESVEYQTMLSITAASLSRKDVLLADAESKIASMAKIIDSLTESNAQLLYRVEQLEGVVAGKGSAAVLGKSLPDGSANANVLGFGARTDVTNFEQMDSMENEKMDRTNRMLLETLFGMARMVEACAIQMAKDVMDSLEHQLDGSLLHTLAEMIHAENVAKAQQDATVMSHAGASTPTTLAGKGFVAIKDLAHMPLDVFLLHWFRLQLQLSSAAEKTSDRVIKNFTTDLVDGRRYSFLLHRLFPTWFDSNMAHEIDVDERLKNVAGFNARVQPPLPQVVSADSIHAANAGDNVAFVAMLFGASVSSTRRINLEKQRGQFLNVITSWKRVRSLLLEVKRMHDHYDALMLNHLVKEMRTCETLFKQLHNELNALAVASNESSSTLAHVAYKTLHLTWKCLHQKATNPLDPLSFIDERQQERVKDFMYVDLNTIRQLLVLQSRQEAMATSVKGVSRALPVPVIPEKDVQLQVDAMRTVVLVYSKDLHDIFKHYSASTGAGSIASLSLSEFQKFLKDCSICDKLVSPALADQIFKTALLFSPLTPRDVVAAVTSAGTASPPSSSAYSASDPLQMEPLLAHFDLGEREMIGLEFVDALLRLAAIKMPSISPLKERFREFMEQCVLPNALRSQSEIFRAEVASPKVHAVFQRHKPALQRVFRYYSSMHALREQQSTIGLKEFLILAKDCKLVGSFVTEHTLKQVLGNLQRDGADVRDHHLSGSSQASDDALLRVDFSDFQEALAALTEYVICNPYVPLYKRIEQFLNELLLPRARQKKTRAGE